MPSGARIALLSACALWAVSFVATKVALEAAPPLVVITMPPVTTPDDIEYMGYAVRTDRYRYVTWMNRETGEFMVSELYDHQADPGENVNLAGRPEYAETLAQLEAVQQAGWRAALPPH